MPTTTILPMDEMNRLEWTLKSKETINSKTGKREYKDHDELFDIVLFLLETAYINGTADAAEQINAIVGYRLLDNTYMQLRNAAYSVFTGKMTVDEAVSNYGKFN